MSGGARAGSMSRSPKYAQDKLGVTAWMSIEAFQQASWPTDFYRPALEAT